MGSGAGKGPRVFYGSGEGFPEDQSAAVGDVPPALLRRVRAWPSPRTPRPQRLPPRPTWTVARCAGPGGAGRNTDRKSTRLNSSHVASSYAVLCGSKKMWTVLVI